MKNLKESKRSHVIAELLKKTKKVLYCRICGGETFCAIDLGYQPFANSLESELNANARTYPLKMHVCKACSTGQLSYCAGSEELYKNYLYVSPDSALLEEHFRKILDFLSENSYLDNMSNVLEIGSNIGNFLNFLKPYVNTIVGVDPAANIAKMANEKGIPTVNDFFNSSSAENILKRDGKKDVIVARHCFAHNEKPGLMLEGVQKLLSDEGVLLVENAYFLDTVMNLEVDQIYHEHMYFYNVRSISEIFNNHGFKLIDVYYSSIHGGTVLYVGKLKNSRHQPHQRVFDFLEKEKDMHRENFYTEFVSKIAKNKEELCELVRKLRSENKTIHIYGAPAYTFVMNRCFPLI